MIISASYRTDIPAFYGSWLMNRLAAGYCVVRNPYSGKGHRVDLRREVVSGIVLWTKNLGPFLPHLPALACMGYPFVVQYTINGYPRALETSVIDSERAIGHIRDLALHYGKRVAVFRYDTIILSSLTDEAFHLRNFARLCQALAGSVDEVVISFAHLYQKTRRNLDRASRESRFTYRDPSADEKQALIGKLVLLAAEAGMRLSVCAQPEYAVHGAAEARCIDVQRLSDIAGRQVRASAKGNRPACACAESRDIGDYDTCPHGCVYCYAVMNRDLARARYQAHDDKGESLFPIPAAQESPAKALKGRTLPLLPED